MSENSSALLTVVVPAYNVEDYIAECLDSLVNQTYQNHKIIVVNDGSSDNTENICLSYQNRFPEMITYIYQENQGLGGARNTGLKLVDTPYVSFLDSDDWLNIKYVESLSSLIEDVDELPDLIFTLPWVYDSVTKRVISWKDKECFDRIFEVNEGISRIQTNSKKKPELYALEVNACRKIYKTAFLKENNFSFPDHLKWEDVPGHFYLLHKANTCMALPDVGFFYRTNQGGQITAGGGASRLDMIPIFEQLLEVVEHNDFNLVEKSYALRLIIDFSIWSINVTNMEYIEPLLKGLHGIFKVFSHDEIKFYLENVSKNREMEYGFVVCLAGENYLQLADYEERESVIAVQGRKIHSSKSMKELIWGGMKCIHEHGVRYTIKWMFKKYLS